MSHSHLIAITMLLVVLAISSAHGADVSKANNTDNLGLGTSWIGGTVPGTGDMAVFDSTYNLGATLDTGAAVDWLGLKVASAGSDVLINNGTSGQEVQLGSSGIDMSAATTNLVIKRFNFSISQPWDIASGTYFRIGDTTATPTGGSDRTGVFVNSTASTETITKSGGGAVYLDTGNTSLGNVNWQIDGGLVAAIWNNSSAWGVGAITLDGGGIVVGTPIHGSWGNWTWNTPILLGPSTANFVDEQNLSNSGAGRYLKLTGGFSDASGPGNVTFLETGGTFTTPDEGYILAGANTFSGTMTIGGPVENGIAGRLTPVRVGCLSTGTATDSGAGTYGTLGTGNVVNNGVLTFTHTDYLDVPNHISGTGTLRIGTLQTSTGNNGLIGAAYQVITLSGTNTYTGPTIINAGTLAIGATGSIANSSNISIVTNSVNGGASINTFDVTALTSGFTTASGQTLSLNGGQVNGTLNLATGSTNIFAPGGNDFIGTLNITGDLNLSGGSNTLVLDINNYANDQVYVGGTLSAGGGVTTLQFVPPSTGLNAGTYTLITAGTIDPGVTATSFAIAGLASGPRPQTFTVQISGNSLQLVVVGSPGNLTWVGDGTANVWSTDTTFSNWYNNTTFAKDIFVQNDQVTFDDTGSTTPAVNLTGPLTPSAVTISTYSADYTFAGSGQIAGATGLTINGTRKLSLLTSNTFTGPISVNGGGILAITNEAALNQPTNPVAQSLTLDNGSALMVSSDMTIGANTNRGIIIGTAGGTLIVTNGATLTVSNVIGDLTGVSVLTKTGDGTLNLDGNNNYGGGTVINGGAVLCGNSHAMGLAGNWSPGFTLQSGVVDVAGQSNYQSTNNPQSYTFPNYLFYGPNAATTPIITFAGNPGATMSFTDSVPGHAGVVLYGGSSVNQAIYYNGANNPGKATMSVPWYGMGSGSYARTFQVQVDPTTASPVGLEIQGQMSGMQYDGRLAIIQKTGDGALEISATNFFPNLQVTAGTLLVNNPWALGVDRSAGYSFYDPSIGSVTNIDGGGSPHQLIVDGGTVDLNGFSPEVGALNDNGGIMTGVITNGGMAPSVLTLGYSISNTVNNASYAGVIASGAQAVSIVKTGTNIQVLAGINTYSGTTVVSNGTLLVNAPGQIGLGGAGSTVTVDRGTLGGSGTINAPTVISSGGTLAPAAGAANTVALTFNADLTLGGTNLMNVNKDTATNDLIMLTSGTVNYGGVLVVSTNLMTSTTLALGDSFQLFSAPAHVGNFSSIVGSPGLDLAWSFDPSTGVLSVVNASAAPVMLTNSISGSTLSLSWPAGQGWRLEYQTNSLASGLSTNWLPLTDSSVSSTNITVDSTKPAVFYRLVNP